MKLAPIDRGALTPLYHQLFSTLRDQILTGAYRAGEALPSERDLAKLYKVSRITAQRAVDELAAQAFVRREQGRGSFVTAGRVPAPINANMQALIDNVIAIGATTTGRVIAIGNIRPPAAVCAAMHLKPREQAQRSVHLRRRDDEPLGLITTYVPRDIGRRISTRDIEAQPMLALLEARGIHPTWAQQAIGAEGANRTVARHLRVAPGTPLVRVQRVVYNREDRPVEYLVALYRSDRYEVRSVLRRELRDDI